MRIVPLLLSLLAAPAHLAAQPPSTPAPAAAGRAKPAQRAAARAPARTALVVTATDPSGATLPGIHVEVLGAVDRSGDTNESGQLRFANMRAGTYRVRFSGPAVITFEREIAVRANRTAELDVTLNPAPAPPEPEPRQEPKPAAPPPAGPPGEPTLLSILELLEKEFVGRQPRRETLLGCSGNSRSTMIQLNDEQPERLYESAESMYYVLGGEGTIRLNGRESPIETGGFAIVPRGAAHAFVRKGRRPLILLWVLSGEPCPAPQ